MASHYFGTKEALLVEAAVAAAHEEYGAARRAIEEAGSLSDATVQATRDERLRQTLFATDRSFLDTVAGMVRRGIDRGELAPDTDWEALTAVL